MSDGFDINALRQLLEAHDARQTMLADGDQELQAQKQQIAEHTSTLAAQASQIEAHETHLAELRHELAVLRGELVTQDKAFDTLPFIEMVASRWSLIDTLHVVSGRLQAWSEMNSRLFQPQSARQIMQQCARLLKQQHSLLVGARGGGG